MPFGRVKWGTMEFSCIPAGSSREAPRAMGSSGGPACSPLTMCRRRSRRARSSSRGPPVSSFGSILGQTFGSVAIRLGSTAEKQ
jgi:hypothetical protein